MNDDLERILNPKSVAVIGASRNIESWGYRIGKMLLENFKGQTYLVNPKADTLLDQKVYHNVKDIDEPIDLAIIAVATTLVPDIVKDCAGKHVGGMIIISAGFGEKSGHWKEGSYSLELGKKLEEEMVEIARAGNSRIIGPNCLGIDNPSIGLNTYGSSQRPSSGPIAFVSQSGNLGDVAFRLVRRKGLGFSYYISVGNEADVQMHEYIKYLRTDPKTKIIALYIEGLKDGRRFFEEAKETAKTKPLVVLKVGRTEAGARAAASHTGSLAGREEVCDAAFKQAGIIRVMDDSELFDVVEALARSPPLSGNRIALLTEGGGHATTAADVCEVFGFKIPVLSNKTQEMLRKILRDHPLSETNNPVDIPGLSGEPQVLAECCRVLLQGNEVDGILIAGLFGTYADMWKLRKDMGRQEEEAASEICRLVREHNKPLIMHSIAAMERPKPLEILGNGGIPVYDTISKAVRCMAALRNFNKYQKRTEEDITNQMEKPSGRPQVDRIIAAVAAKGRANLLETEAKEILREYDIPTPEFRLAENKGEAVRIARETGYPIVMKIVSPQILHKSDAGGVKINLRDEEEVEKAFEEIIKNAKNYNKDAEISGAIMYRFVPKGIEIIVGLTKDPQFGPVLMFGLGGVFVEVLKDVSFRVPPIERRDAYEMIREIKGYQILEGVRGEKRKDIDAIADIIMKVSQIAIENSEIKELDLNPIIAYEDRVVVVDARVILSNA